MSKKKEAMSKKKEAVEKPQIMSLNDNKAGMTGLDKEKIDAIIYEASKNSPFFKNQQLKQEAIDKKVEAMDIKLSEYGEITRRQARMEADDMIAKLEPIRKDLSRIIVHVDMDMFYAAVETIDNLALKNIPMAVGCKSMLSTSNYHARKFGVRAGMPGFIALKLCPQLRIVPLNFKRYQEKSDEVMDVMKTYDPNFCRMGLDECYIDLTDHVTHRYLAGGGKIWAETNGDQEKVLPEVIWDLASKVVSELRNKVKESTKLTCSAGIAHNKMLAKYCSDIKKPDDQYLLKATSMDKVQRFLETIPVRKINGIGPVQQQLLEKFGIKTCRELYDKRDIIILLFYPSSIDFYLKVAVGVSSNVVPSEDSQRKSKGSEHTLSAPTDNLDSLNDFIDILSNDVAGNLKRYGLRGRTLTLNIKWATYKRNQRSISINFHTNDAIVIAKHTKDLLHKEIESKKQKNEATKIRLVGVRVSSFEDEHSGDEEEYSKGEKKRSLQPKIEDYLKKLRPDSAPEIKDIENKAIEDLKDVSERERLVDSHIKNRYPNVRDPFLTATERKKIDEIVDEELSDGSDFIEEFICCYCHLDFNTMESLETHVINEPNCDNRQSLVTSFPKMQSSSTNVESFTCPICSYSVEDLARLNSHIDECLNRDLINQVKPSDTNVC